MKNSNIKKRLLRYDKRALSPIFSTILLAAIIIIIGSVAFYYANNVTTTATNDYVKTSVQNQASMSERIGFENVIYKQLDSSFSPPSPTLTIYIINCGNAYNLKINTLFLYDVNQQLVGTHPYAVNENPDSALRDIDEMTQFPDNKIPSNHLNIGQEGYFIVPLDSGISLSSGSIYTIHLITERGSSFDYQFTP